MSKDWHQLEQRFHGKVANLMPREELQVLETKKGKEKNGNGSLKNSLSSVQNNWIKTRGRKRMLQKLSLHTQRERERERKREMTKRGKRRRRREVKLQILW